MKYTKQQQEEVKHFLEFLDIRTGIKNLEFSNADVITDMQEEIERLNNIINKAIEYIKRYEIISGYYDSNYDGEADTYSHDNVKDDLLQMLDKDSDKE